MSSAWRTFWRRFLLIEPKSAWTAGELKRQPELRHIPPTDPYFAPRATLARILRFGVPWFVAASLIACAIHGAFTLLGFGLWKAVATPALVTSPNGMSILRIGGFVFLIVQWGTTLAFVLWCGQRLGQRRCRILRSELRRRGIPICIRCGYEGGDISAPRCPECGAPVSS